MSWLSSLLQARWPFRATWFLEQEDKRLVRASRKHTRSSRSSDGVPQVMLSGTASHASGPGTLPIARVFGSNNFRILTPGFTGATATTPKIALSRANLRHDHPIFHRLARGNFLQSHGEFAIRYTSFVLEHFPEGLNEPGFLFGSISPDLSFASPTARALAKGLPEQLAKMRLIRKPRV
jgi:hypothetical protein